MKGLRAEGGELRANPLVLVRDSPAPIAKANEAAELAKGLGIQQPTLSKLESQHDMQVSTWERLVAALGGKLEIIAHLPGGTIRITQFEDAA